MAVVTIKGWSVSSIGREAKLRNGSLELSRISPGSELEITRVLEIEPGRKDAQRFNITVSLPELLKALAEIVRDGEPERPSGGRRSHVAISDLLNMIADEVF